MSDGEEESDSEGDDAGGDNASDVASWAKLLHLAREMVDTRKVATGAGVCCLYRVAMPYPDQLY